jgi:hypothetical protein
VYLPQFLFQCLAFAHQTGIRFRALARTIDRLTEAKQITEQSRAEVGQGQVILIESRDSSLQQIVETNLVRLVKEYIVATVHT